MNDPKHFSCHILPIHYKNLGKISVNNAISMLKTHNFPQLQIDRLEGSHAWVETHNTWEEQHNLFKSEIERLDNIRGENFEKVFPELAPLLDIR